MTDSPSQRGEDRTGGRKRRPHEYIHTRMDVQTKNSYFSFKIRDSNPSAHILILSVMFVPNKIKK